MANETGHEELDRINAQSAAGTPGTLTGSNSQAVLIQEIAGLRAELAGEKAKVARLEGLLHQAKLKIIRLEGELPE
jgi:hypothetical protein